MILARKLASSRGGGRAAMIAITAFGLEFDSGWSLSISKYPPISLTTKILCYDRYGVDAKTHCSMQPLHSIVTLVGEMDDGNRKDGSDTKWKETVRKVSENIKEGWEGSKEEATKRAEDVKQKAKDLYYQHASPENVYKV